jgi:PTH1 family peptidyl-tRNA hydrolase
MKLIVGLGNPGQKYHGTRHNVGFDMLEILRKRWQLASVRPQFQAEVGEWTWQGEKVLLLWPQTFMNLSGASVLAARDFYKIPATQILIVCDDFALPLGKLRIRPKGTAGGQKGLADIIKRLGTELLPRLRIGVGPLPAGWDAADFVLGKFRQAEKIEIEIALERAADAAAQWATSGDLSAVMNQYNQEPPQPAD